MEDNNIEIKHTEQFLKWTSTTNNLHVVKVILVFQQLPVYCPRFTVYVTIIMHLHTI